MPTDSHILTFSCPKRPGRHIDGRVILNGVRTVVFRD